MDNNEENAIPESKVTITFAAPGSVLMQIDAKNVVPLQVIAAAWYLQKQAEAGFFQQEVAKQQQQEMQKIAIPTPELRKPIIRPK